MRKTSRRGAAGQQYAIIVGLVGVVALFSITYVGSSVSNMFTSVSNTVGRVNNGGTSATVPPPPPPPAAQLTAANATIDQMAIPGACANVTFTNSGAGTASGFSAPVVTGTYETTGCSATTCTGSLAPAASCTVSVRGTAVSNGALNGTVQVTATSGGSATATVSGTATVGDFGPLVAGNTTRIATNGNFQFRCTIWNGQTCDRPEMRVTVSMPYDGGDLINQWHWMETGGTLAMCTWYCAASNSGALVTHGQPSGQRVSSDRWWTGPQASAGSDSSYVYTQCIAGGCPQFYKQTGVNNDANDINCRCANW